MSKSKHTTVQDRWTTMNNKKGDVLERYEKYARWTIPHVFPDENVTDKEQRTSMNSIGAEVSNHLANRVTTTLFSPHSPYFRLLVEGTVEAEIIDSGVKKAELDFSLAQAERKAVKHQERVKHLRSTATLAAKLLVITGNALIYYNTKDSPIQIYTARNFCVQRDGDGIPIRIMTRDHKVWENIPEDIKEELPKEYTRSKEPMDKVTVYTEVRPQKDNPDKWEVQQGIDDNDLKPTGNYPTDKLPWIPLVWHLNKGEDYGRGLVEDYAGDFHALTTLSESLVRGLAVLADIKFLVRPGALTNVQEFNSSETGSYHVGNEGDITSPQFNKFADFQAIERAIDKYERRLARAFLMSSAVTRDAERVTAEEIRRDIQELETGHGGLYSRMVDEWQKPYAVLALRDIEFDLLDDTFEVQIITGMDTLSRTGDMDNFRWFLEDMAVFNTLPEEFRAAFDPFSTADFIASNRGVDHTKFMKTREQFQKEQQAAQQATMQQEMAMRGMDAATAEVTKGDE